MDDAWMGLEVSGRRVNFVDSDYSDNGTQERWREAFPAATGFHEKPMALREIFVALAKKYRLTENTNLEN